MNKFNLNDEVYYMHDNKLKSGRVLGIRFHDYGYPKCSNPILLYDVSMPGMLSISRIETEVFKTREELLTYLLSD